MLISSVVPHVAKSDEHPNRVPAKTLEGSTNALTADRQGFVPRSTAKLIEYRASPHAVFATDQDRSIDDVKRFLDAAFGERSAIPLQTTETV